MVHELGHTGAGAAGDIRSVSDPIQAVVGVN